MAWQFTTSECGSNRKKWLAIYQIQGRKVINVIVVWNCFPKRSHFFAPGIPDCPHNWLQLIRGRFLHQSLGFDCSFSILPRPPLFFEPTIQPYRIYLFSTFSLLISVILTLKSWQRYKFIITFHIQKSLVAEPPEPNYYQLLDFYNNLIAIQKKFPAHKVSRKIKIWIATAVSKQLTETIRWI